MARRYNMEFTVHVKTKKECKTVLDAIKTRWKVEGHNKPYGCDDHEDFPYQMDAWGEGHLCGGLGEDEFSEQMAQRIWDVIGEFRPVLVRAVYMDDLPFNEYEFGDKEYKRASV